MNKEDGKQKEVFASLAIDNISRGSKGVKMAVKGCSRATYIT